MHTKQEAQNAADTINAYWRKMGVKANARVIRIDPPPKWRDRTVYGIESDLTLKTPLAGHRRIAG